jgi:hypothetical protein
MSERMPYAETDNITLAKLALLSERARKDSKLQFTSLAHLLNEGFLKECYYRLGRDRARGIDGVSWEEYGEHLDENIATLVVRMKTKRYRPQPSRRVFKWLNRRSQKISFNGPGFQAYLKHYPLPKPRVAYRLFAPPTVAGDLRKSRMREICTSGSVRGVDALTHGRIL